MIIVELSVLNIGGGRSEAVLLEIITDYQTNSQGRLWHFLFKKKTNHLLMLEILR